MCVGSKLAVVITTINSVTPGVMSISEGMEGTGGRLFVVCDRKTPIGLSVGSAVVLSYADQLQSRFATAGAVLPDSYARKMLGYLAAFEQGYTSIRETDDDNIPYESFFETPANRMTVRVAPPNKWVNPYAFFSNQFIWPRGFPLNQVRDSFEQVNLEEVSISQPILLQSLADGDPDVDAVYRLTSPHVSPVTFEQLKPLLIPFGSWAPFNSQVTTWPRELYPLMYLPSTCSFRMTDIWRSFITLRIMREIGAHLVFSRSSVFQDRNSHDLFEDFRAELEGYVGYQRFVDVLDAIPDESIRTTSDGLRSAYVALIEEDFFDKSELHILDCWLQDLKLIGVI